jgi:ABC-type thiamine transport system substrate-binding protein
LLRRLCLLIAIKTVNVVVDYYYVAVLYDKTQMYNIPVSLKDGPIS